jgi:putative transposase
MIEPGHPRLSIVRQCELASISRSSFYREPTAVSEATLRLMRLIDEQFLETPWYGSRQMARHLRRNGWCVGRHRVRRLMLKMGLAPIYQRPKTSEPHPQHRTWPTNASTSMPSRLAVRQEQGSFVGSPTTTAHQNTHLSM